MITDPADIKILICYIIAFVRGGMNGEELCRVLSNEGAVNYFDVGASVGELKNDGFLKEDGGLLTVTERGLQIAATFNRKLPSATKQTAVENALRLAAAQRSRTENPCEILPAENGFTVSMRILDGKDELLAVKLFASDREQAEALKSRFEGDPMFAYTGIIALLTGDINSVGGALLSSPKD